MSAEPVKFGLTLYPDEWADAALVEELGYDSLWTGDHILFLTPWFEAITTLAYWAGQTRRIRLGSGVLILPLRQAAVLAKQVACLDVLSGGRVILGVGTSGPRNPRPELHATEFAACERDPHRRGAQTDAAIRQMRAFWRGEPVPIEDRLVPPADAPMLPRPLQPGGPPIWVGGRDRATLRRAGQLGDGFLPFLLKPEEYAERLGRVRQIAEEVGRDPAAISAGHFFYVGVAPDEATARRHAAAQLYRRYREHSEAILDRLGVFGPPELCAERLATYVAAGAQHFALTPLYAPGQAAAQVEAIAQQVLPRVRAAVGGSIP